MRDKSLSMRTQPTHQTDVLGESTAVELADGETAGVDLGLSRATATIGEK